jgi:hypothetical protein
MESTIAFLWQRCNKVTGIASYDFRIYGNDFRKNGSGFESHNNHIKSNNKQIINVQNINAL